ncbi:hypothetical protein Hanom_Chr07g00607881 [Helianthus anomalus]
MLGKNVDSQECLATLIVCIGNGKIVPMLGLGNMQVEAANQQSF